MAAIVTTTCFGNPDVEKSIATRIREYMGQIPGQWTVQLLGAAHNTIWEMTVTAPDGITQWLKKLYGEDGGHQIENILTELRNIVGA